MVDDVRSRLAAVMAKLDAGPWGLDDLLIALRADGLLVDGCPPPISPTRQVAAEQARRAMRADADDVDDPDDATIEPDATPIDIDDYGAVRSRDWHRGFVDGLLFRTCGPYSDGSWRSTHPQARANREAEPS